MHSSSQVSAWGGYVFIINLIPLHVFVLILMGKYSNRIYTGMPYFCFYAEHTAGKIYELTLINLRKPPHYFGSMTYWKWICRKILIKCHIYEHLFQDTAFRLAKFCCWNFQVLSSTLKIFMSMLSLAEREDYAPWTCIRFENSGTAF